MPSASDQPHSAYAAPSTDAHHHTPAGPIRRSRNVIAAAATAVFRTVIPYTAYSMSPRGKSATSGAKGLDR